MALGINQIAALAGQFLGLLAGGLLADDRLAGGVLGQRADRRCSARCGRTAACARSRRTAPGQDRLGRQHHLRPRDGVAARRDHLRHPALRRSTRPGWSNPSSSAASSAGVLLLVAFCVIETRVAEPMFDLSLFRIRAFSAGNLAALLTAIARGGLQFMLIIWLQGIWLPLHGYDFESTPLWAGIFMLPLTAGFLLAGPTAGYLSDRFGAAAALHRRPAAGRGVVPRAARAAGRLLLPGLRRAARAQRDRPGRVLRTQHLGDHEQRARRTSAASPRACARRSRTPGRRCRSASSSP